MSQVIMTADQASACYDVLVRECGARDDPDERHSFVFHCTPNEKHRGHPTREYRFQGSLGFGGKFRNTDRRLYVDCYEEHRTSERHAAIERANMALTDLMLQWRDAEDAARLVALETELATIESDKADVIATREQTRAAITACEQLRKTLRGE